MKSSISSLLERLVEVKNAIANAIVAKGGTVNDGDGLEEFVGDIADIPTGGATEVETKDVNFYDYDGTVINSYTAEEFANLTTLPSNPSHSGLISQGWNWSLADAKTYVAANRFLNISQMYTTTDGATRFHIDISNLQNLSFYLCLKVNGTLTINWGDDSAVETMTGANYAASNLQHTYTETGKYVISVTPSSGSAWKFDYTGNNSIIIRSSTNDSNSARLPYLNLIKEINFGSGITEIDDYGCSYLYSLAYISFPNTITSINKFAFNYCYSLQFVGIPSSVTTLKQNCFQWCSAIKVIALPNSITTFANAMFAYCSAVTSLTIPSTMTNTMDSGFAYMYLLKRVVIPDTLSVIYSSGFNSLYVCSYVKFISSIPPTVYSSSAFYSLNQSCILLVPLGARAAYTSASNYPSSSNYNYIEYATYANDAALPTTSQDEQYTYVWYATTDDWKAQTNPITVGNGKEIYCRSTAVS